MPDVYEAVSEATASFKTYSNYLRAFMTIARGTGLDTRDFLLRQVHTKLFESGRLPRSPCLDADLRQVETSLKIAWGTELLLAMGERFDSDELIRLSNNWSVVQTYYVLYHATQAIVVAQGTTRPESHPATQKQFYNLFANRGTGLEPWTMAVDIDGAKNIPTGVTVDDSMHPWSTCTSRTCWNLAYKALRTARQEQLKERYKEARDEKKRNKRKTWKKEENDRIKAGRKPRVERPFPLPLLTPAEKTNINRNYRPFTLIDFLHRLRIRTNYKDSAMFTDGPLAGESKLVRDDLIGLAAASLLIAELHVRALVGEQEFDAWVEAWVQTYALFDPPIGLATRKNLHKPPPATRHFSMKSDAFRS